MLIALAAAVLGYLLLLGTSPRRAVLWDGWRCVRRYSSLWKILGLLGCAHALFELAVRLRLQFTLADGAPVQLVWGRAAWRDPGLWLNGSPDSLWWLPPSAIRASLSESWLPGLEWVAGLFNNVVTTFPIAILAALALLVNRHRWLSHLRDALHRRFGAVSWLLLFAVCLCAVAVLLKAVLYFRPTWLFHLSGLSEPAWDQCSQVIAWMAFLFEYLFGLGLQIYLILHAYAWVRGITFEAEAMQDVALRRLGAGAKWAGLVILAATLLIDLPLMLKNFPGFSAWFPDDPAILDHRLRIARIVLASLLLLGASIQAWLTLHGETLSRAFHAHWCLAKKHWPALLWFFAVASFHGFAVNFLRAVVLEGVGGETAIGVTWTLIWPWLAAPVTAWMLASWVCLFKQLEAAGL